MPELVRTLRLRDLLLLFIGSVIGSGIFRTPGPILRQVDGSVGLSLFVLILGGVLSPLGGREWTEQREDAAQYPNQERKADGAGDMARKRSKRSKTTRGDVGGD